MQFYWSNYQDTGLVDIVAALFSLLAMVALLKVWQPRTILRLPATLPSPVRHRG
jgi:L-lactate permease